MSYIHMHMCTYIYRYICIQIHTYIHTYILAEDHSVNPAPVTGLEAFRFPFLLELKGRCSLCQGFEFRVSGVGATGFSVRFLGFRV